MVVTYVTVWKYVALYTPLARCVLIAMSLLYIARVSIVQTPA